MAMYFSRNIQNGDSSPPYGTKGSQLFFGTEPEVEIGTGGGGRQEYCGTEDCESVIKRQTEE